jgi:hypothetical protein
VCVCPVGKRVLGSAENEKGVDSDAQVADVNEKVTH